MDREERFWQKGIDTRRLYLYLTGKLWIALVVAALGALVALAVYYPVHALRSGEPKYEGTSQYYITFERDEFGDVYDYYNAYTWDHDVITCDAIADKVLSELPPETTREELRESVSAQLPGDYRFMTLSVATPDPDLTKAIREAYDGALSDFASETAGLGEITLTQRGPIRLAETEYRTLPVALLGAALGFLVTLFLLLLQFGMDDAFYVERDVTECLPYPFLGQVTRERTALYLKELWLNLSYLGGAGSYCLTGCDERANRETLDALKVLADAEKSQPEESQPNDSKGGYSFRIVGNGGAHSLTEADYDSLRQSDAALLVLAYGKRDQRAAVHLAGQLKRQGCRVLGVILTGGRERFYRRYEGERALMGRDKGKPT